MEHQFDVNIAKLCGVNSAILFNNIKFWILKNKANGQNFHDGTYWTYNSKAAFAELFPYFTARQIDYALKKLIDEGLIITGNFNQSPYDRTLWYALTEKGEYILQGGEVHCTNLLNQANENVQPIPDINTDINTDKKPDNKELKKVSKRETFDDIIDGYSQDEKVRELLREWLKVRAVKRATATNYAIKLNLEKLDMLAHESELTVKEYLKEVIRRGWIAFYKIPEYNKKEVTTPFDDRV